jgi:hypothetical protein
MSQGVVTIADGSGLAVLAAINAANARFATMASGTARPSDIGTGELWRETDNPGGGVHSVWLYDGASDVLLFTLDTAAHTIKYTSAGLDSLLGSTQGMVAYRGASSWAGLAAGADAYKALFSGGSGANPAWAGTWKVLGTATPAGASAVDFTSIPATVNHLLALFELLPATNGVNLGVRTYGADGVLDTGGTDYAHAHLGINTAAGSALGGANGSSILINLAANPIANDASTGGISGFVKFEAIQAARHTRCQFQATYGPDTVGSAYLAMNGGGWRLEADRITGLRFLMSSGNLTGRVTLLGLSD